MARTYVAALASQQALLGTIAGASPDSSGGGQHPFTTQGIAPGPYPRGPTSVTDDDGGDGGGGSTVMSSFAGHDDGMSSFMSSFVGHDVPTTDSEGGGDVGSHFGPWLTEGSLPEGTSAGGSQVSDRW